MDTTGAVNCTVPNTTPATTAFEDQITKNNNNNMVATKATRIQVRRAAGSQSLEKLKAVLATGWTREDLDNMALEPKAKEQTNEEATHSTASTGPPPFATTINGKTALHMAASTGHLDNLKYLVQDMGCNVNVIATGIHSYGKTALFFACTKTRPLHMQFLLDHGAQVKIVNNKGQSVRSLAYSHFVLSDDQPSSSSLQTVHDSIATSPDMTKTNILNKTIWQRIQELEESDPTPWINYRTTHSDGLIYGDLDPRFVDPSVVGVSTLEKTPHWPYSLHPTTRETRRGNFARNNPNYVSNVDADGDSTTNKSTKSKKPKPPPRRLTEQEQTQLDEWWQSLATALCHRRQNASATTTTFAQLNHLDASATTETSPSSSPESAEKLLLDILTLCDQQNYSWLPEVVSKLCTLWTRSYDDDKKHSWIPEVLSKLWTRPCEDDDNNKDNRRSTIITQTEELIAWLKTIPPQSCRQHVLLYKLTETIWRIATDPAVDDDDDDNNNNTSNLLAPLPMLNKKDFVAPPSTSAQVNTHKEKKPSMARQSLQTGLWPQACRAVQGLSFVHSLSHKPAPAIIELPEWMVQRQRWKQKRLLRKLQPNERLEQEASNSTSISATPQSNNYSTMASTPESLSTTTTTTTTTTSIDTKQQESALPVQEPDTTIEEYQTVTPTGRILSLLAPPIWIDSIEGLEQLRQTLDLPSTSTSTNISTNTANQTPARMIVAMDTEWTSHTEIPKEVSVSTVQLAIVKRTANETEETLVLNQQQHDMQRPVLETFVVDLLVAEKNSDYRRVCRELFSSLFETHIVLGFSFGNDIPKLQQSLTRPSEEDKESLTLSKENVLDLQRLWPKKEQPGLAKCAGLYCNRNQNDRISDDENSMTEEEHSPTKDTEDVNREKDNDGTSRLIRLSKDQQCSNWRRRPLRPEQLEYAALDAAVLLVILAEKARSDCEESNNSSIP